MTFADVGDEPGRVPQQLQRPHLQVKVNNLRDVSQSQQLTGCWGAYEAIYPREDVSQQLQVKVNILRDVSQSQELKGQSQQVKVNNLRDVGGRTRRYIPERMSLFSCSTILIWGLGFGALGLGSSV